MNIKIELKIINVVLPYLYNPFFFEKRRDPCGAIAVHQFFPLISHFDSFLPGQGIQTIDKTSF
jgi:hypothetical protein